MATVVAGNSLGLSNTSLYVLGSQGALGRATQGRAGEQVFVNGATGNLVIQNRDEILIGRGPDIGILRTYNSQGLVDGDNNDNWRIGVYRKVYNLSGTVNTAGSTVTRVAEDGSESVYTYDTTLGKYVCHDGGGSYDTLGFANQTWTWSWTDGTNQLTELYDASNGGRIKSLSDQDGNGLTFTYNATTGLITQVTDASGETTFLDYTGTNLTLLRTVNSSAQTLIRTRYTYDLNNRLSQVTTDLSPEDASIADGNTYWVKYTYDDAAGVSKRVKTLEQSDGNNLIFAYEQVGTSTTFRLKSYTDAAGKLTTFRYTPGSSTTVSTTATANNTVLSTTETQTTTTTVAPYYTVTSTDNWTTITQTVYGTSNANAVAALQAAMGSPLPTLTQGLKLTVPQSITYNGGTASATANPAVLSTTLTSTVPPYYTVQAGSTWASITQAVYGTSDANAVAALQVALNNSTLSTGLRLTVPQTLTYGGSSTAAANSAALSTTLTTTTTYDLNTSALTASTTTPAGWGTAALVAGSGTSSGVSSPQVRFDQNGNGMAVWSTDTDVFYSLYTKSTDSWSAAQTLDGTLTGSIWGVHLSMSANGNALVTWGQGVSTNPTTYARRYIAGVWDGATTIPLLGGGSAPVGAINDSGRAVVTFIQTFGSFWGTTTNVYASVYDGTSWQGASALDDLGGGNTWWTDSPSVAIDPLNNATVLWIQNPVTGSSDLHLSRYTASTGTWSAPSNTFFDNTIVAADQPSISYAAPSIAFDGNGNGIAIWRQDGTLFAKSYTRSSDTWSTVATNLGTGMGAGHLSMSANGNALVTWTDANGNILARRYTAGLWLGTAPETIENAAGAASNPTGAINDAGLAAVSFVQANGTVNDVLVNRFAIGGWQASASLVESNANSVVAQNASVAIDAQGNIATFWLQKNGLETTDSVYRSRYSATTFTYTIPSGATWSSIAQTLYGTTTAASALQSALGNPLLVAGDQLTGFPVSLTVTTTSTVAPYYTVQANDTWSSIAQAVYGDKAAAGPLQTAPALTTGLRLTVPGSITYNPIVASINTAALTTTEPQTTTYSLNTGAIGGPTGTNVLQNWTPVTGLSAATNALLQYTIQVPPGQSELVVSTTGGSTGDADLFVRFGAAPTWSLYDATAGASGNNEAVVIRNPSAGTWYVAVGAFSAFSGVQLQAYYQNVPSSTVVLQPNTAVSDLSDNGDADRLFSFNIAAGTTSFNLALSGVTSGQDADLYLKFGAPPDITYDFSSGNVGVNESIRVNSPQAGTWYAAVKGFWPGGYADAKLLLSTNLGTNTPPKAEAGPGKNVTAGAVVSLAATGSDAQGAVTYQWTQIGGPSVTLTNATSATASFTAPTVSSPTLLDFRVRVTDGQGASNTDVVHVLVRTPTGAYIVGSGDTWASIATKVYGSSAVASALQQALGNPALTVGAQLTGFPPTLSVTSIITVAPYYLVKSTDSWTTIAQAVYGSGEANAAMALRDALGNPALSQGLKLTMPASIRYSTATPSGTTSASANNTVLSTTLTETVPAYYTVQAGNTWASITQTVYRTTDPNAAAALQALLGNPALTAGLRLTVPQTLNYNGTTTSGANSTVLSTTVTTTTTTTVAPYYAVQPGDTWASIAQTVYGDSQAGSALQTALAGGASPVVGAHLTVPQSLTYNRTVSAGLNVEVTDPLGLVSTLISDGQGQLTQILLPTVGGVRQSVSYGYDANGNVTQVTDARGLITTYGYDANGNRTFARDAAGNTIQRTYSAKSELQSETSYLVPDPDGIGPGQPSSPLTTRYVYDANSHLRFVVSGEGRVSEYRYNPQGQRVASIQYTGSLYNLTGLTPTSPPLTESQLTSFVASADKTKSLRVDSTYDFRGLLRTTTSYQAVDATGVGVDSTKAVTQYIYDQAGNLLTTIDPRGMATSAVANDYVTNSTYDGLGRLTSTTVYDDQGLPLVTVDAQGRTSVIRYDDVGRKTILTSANGLVTTSSYDAKGQLISVLQNGGTDGSSTTSYFYDADGRLRRTVDSTGVTTHILYDEAGRKIADIDGTGSLTEYRYDADNNLTRTLQYATAVGAAALASLTDAQGPTAVTLVTTAAGTGIRPAATGQDRIRWNTYDNANRLEKSVDELGYVTQNFYDGADRLVRVRRFNNPIVTNTLGDTPASASISPTADDFNDRISRNLYDGDGRLRATLDAEGYLVEYKYDAAGQLVETVGYATATDPTQRAAGTLAQLLQVPVAANNPDDIHSYNLYNAQGQLVGMVDGEGYLTETAYDLAGNKRQVTRYATKVSFSPGASLASLRAGALSVASSQDQVSTFTYTALNQLASSTDFEGTVTNYTYDNAGNLTKTVTAASTIDARTVNGQYDKLGRLKAQLSGVGSALITSGLTQGQIDAIWAANQTKYDYDAAGRRISATDAATNKTLYYYDADGHLTHTINAAGEVQENQYNALGQLKQTIAYDTPLSSAVLATLSGGLVNSTLTNAISGPSGIANAALDSVTALAYTLRGQVGTATDALSLATTNTYNAFGDRTASSEQLGSGVTLDHSYEFDKRGFLKRTVWDPSALNTSESTQYDAFGRAFQSTDANGNVRTRTYDHLGRVVTTLLDPGAGHLAIGAAASYDAFDRVLTQRDGLNNLTTYRYDKTNRSVVVTTPEGVSVTTVHNRQGETQSITDGRGNVTKYDYDPDGNLKQVTRANAQAQAISTTVNLYDAADRLTDTTDGAGNTVHYTYDTANRVFTRVVDPAGLALKTTYKYNTRGQTVTVTDARNIVTRTEFDLGGRTTKVIVDLGTGQLNLTTTYQYDGKNTLTVTEGVGGTRTRVTKYTYDKLGRRTQEQVDPAGLNITTTYTYDKNNNVVSKTEALNKPEARTTRYVYDAADRLVWTIDALGDVRKNEYDADGHVTRTIAYAKPLANFVTLPAIPAASDVSSRLSTSAGDQAVNHVFDRDGREVYTIDAMGGVTQKVYDAAGNVIQTTAYATAISVPASPTPAAVAALVSASNPDNRITRAVYDAANRAVFAIDGMGYVTQRFYDGAGNVTKEVKYWNALQGTFTAGSAPQILTTAPVPPSGSWVIVDAVRDQITRQFYDAAGRMRFGVNAEGYVTERRLDAMGNETARIRYADRSTVTDSTTMANMTVLFPNVALTALPATAVVEQVSYDSAGRVFELTDGEGVVTRNLYDALYKTDVIRAFGTSLASTTHYNYDNAGREIEEIADYNPAPGTTAINAATRYVLDAFGNRTGIIDPRGVEITEQETAWAKAERLRLGLFASVAALSLQEKTDLLASYTTTLTFDKAGRQTGSTVPAGFRAPGNVTTTVYDARGNAVKITDPRGNSGYFYFDANDKARFHIDPMGYVTEIRYDAFGTIKDELHYANKITGIYDQNTTVSDLASRVAAGASLDDRQTSWVYDRVGQVSTITYQGTPTSYTETFQYDAFGNKRQYKDKSDAVYNYEYDRVGNLKREIAPAADIVTPGGTINTRLTTVYDYDAVGNRSKMTEALGIAQVERVTSYKYDKLGRQTHVDAPAFIVFDRTSGASTSRIPTTDRTYDKAGNLVMEVEPNGGVVLNYYDALNRKIASVDAENALHEYEYDRAGNLIRERTYDTRLAGPLTWQTRPTPVNPGAFREMRYRYNANNLRTATETPVETLFSTAAWLSKTNAYQPGSAMTTTEYNANGYVSRTVDANGYSTYQFYDAVGNHILQVQAYRSYEQQLQPNGSKITVLSAPVGYVTRWEYNAEGQVKVLTQYASALSAATMASLTTTTDPQSLIAALDAAPSPEDRVTEYSFDRLGRVTMERKKAVTYSTIDPNTGAKTDQTGDLDTRFEYDGNGKVKAVVLPNAQGRTDYAYDALGRRTQELDPTFQAFTSYGGALTTTREETRWQYDAFGNVAVETKLALVSTDNRETRRTYDSAGRLRTEVDPEGLTTTYDYDIAGNVVRKTWQVKDVDLKNHTYRCYYTYDHLNRQISYQDTEDEGSALPVIMKTRDTRYNAHGDIEAKGINGQFQEQYKYDRLGRLFFTNADNGTPRLYVYDANGNAVLEVHGINSDLNTLGGVPVTSPSQVQGFALGVDVQLTVSLYDSRNQITEVLQPPMDYASLTAAVSVSGPNAPALATMALPDLHQYQPTGAFTLSPSALPVTVALPPTPQLPAATLGQPITQTSFGANIPTPPATRNDPIPQSSINALAVNPAPVESPIEKLNPDQFSADGLTRTVTERFRRTTYSTALENDPNQPNAKIRTITATTDEIVRTTIFTAVQPTNTFGTTASTADTLTVTWNVKQQEDLSVDRRVDVVKDTVKWEHKVNIAGGWVGAAAGTDPSKAANVGSATYTLPGTITVNTVDELVPDGEGGFGSSGFYYVTVHVPPVDVGGNSGVFVSYIWDNGATAVWNLPVDGNGNATQRVRVDGKAIYVTKGLYGAAGTTLLATFIMDRFVYTASAPLAYAVPGVITASTVDVLQPDGEGGFVFSGWYNVTVNVPPAVNFHAGDDRYYVTYIWDNGATIVWNVPVDANGNATQLVRFDGKAIVVTKGAYGSADYAVIGSFVMDRSVYFASVQETVSNATVVAIQGLASTAARVVFTPQGGAPVEAYRVNLAGTIEFQALTRLSPGLSYDYDVLAANGALLNRVHGVLGGKLPDGRPNNVNYYTITSTDVVTPTTSRQTLTPSWFRNDPAPTVVDVGQQTYLRILSEQLAQGVVQSNVIDRLQAYNAFGEVKSETDGNGNKTDLFYNDLGKLITKLDPETDVHMETGNPIKKRPTTRYFYDEVGQLVATQDAVSELSATKYYSTRVLAAGRVAKEFDASQASKVHVYDRLGNQRLVTDEIGLDTEYRYDRAGRLKRVIRYDKNHLQFTSDDFEYDLAGNRIAHTNGLGKRETYLYDGQQRIRRHISFGLVQTSYDYDYIANDPTVGPIGGYEKRTTTAGVSGNDVVTDRTDYFGKIRYHKDMGGHEFTYVYNNAGWLKQQDGNTAALGRPAQHITYDYYQNGFLKSITDTGVNSLAEFQYDKNGNRTLEKYSQVPIGGTQPTLFQASFAAYDELNRLKRVHDDARFDISYTYDANSNRRSIQSTYFDLLSNLPNQVQNFYYLYDRMNRFVTTMGQRNPVTGKIERSTTGFDIEYDALGRRKKVYSDHTDVGTGTPAATIEAYDYDPINTVLSAEITNVTANTIRYTTRSNDAIGRVNDYREYNRTYDINHVPTDVPTRWVHYEYNNDNLTTLEETHDTLTPNQYQSTTYFYVGNGILDYAQIKTLTAPNQPLANSATVTLKYAHDANGAEAYEKWDTYKQKTVTISGAAARVYGWLDGTSTYSYDSNGHVSKVVDSQANRTFTYVNNPNGQIMRRFEGTASPSIRYFYILNGVTIGDVGTDRKASLVDYAQALADYDQRALQNHVRRNGDLVHVDDGSENGYDVSTTETVTRERGIRQRVFPVTSADFDQNYRPITDSYPAHAASSYVTRSGDNLQSIALAVWGDASLWYILADANGLTGAERLPADLRLTIPNVVTNVHNTASTFRPYDPGFALGDTTPTLPDPPPPPRDEGCGAFGAILVMVVVIIVAYYTQQWWLLEEGEVIAGTAAAAGEGTITGADVVASGALAGTPAATEAAIVGAAAGNLAGQAVANMIGMQNGFSMGSFLSSVATAGIGGVIGDIGSGVWGEMATYGVKNAIGQGVNIITGQQQRFDWRGVAAAALEAPVSRWAGEGFAQLTGGSKYGFAYDFASGAVREGINVAAHRGKVRFNAGKVFADAYGRAIGTSLADQLLYESPAVEAVTMARATEIGDVEYDPGYSFSDPTANLGGPLGGVRFNKPGRSSALSNASLRIYNGVEDLITATASGTADPLLREELLTRGLASLRTQRDNLQGPDLLREVVQQGMNDAKDASQIGTMSALLDPETLQRIAVASKLAGPPGTYTPGQLQAQLAYLNDYPEASVWAMDADASVLKAAPRVFLDSLAGLRKHGDSMNLFVASLSDTDFDRIYNFARATIETNGFTPQSTKDGFANLWSGLQGNPNAINRLAEGMSIAGMGLRRFAMSLGEKMTDVYLGIDTLPKGLEFLAVGMRPMFVVPPQKGNLPPVLLSRSRYTITGNIANDPAAFVMASPQGNGVVVVSVIDRGGLPKGSGGEFLAETLRGHGELPTRQLVFSPIGNPPTVATYKAGGDPATSVLGITGTRALEHLGIEPVAYRWQMVWGKLGLVIDTRKPKP